MTSKHFQKKIPALEQNSPSKNLSVSVVRGDDPYHYEAILFGPADSPFEGGVYLLDFQCPAEYLFT